LQVADRYCELTCPDDLDCDRISFCH
jgi:hypothetical protein